MTQPRPRIGVTHWEDVPGGRFANYTDAVEQAGALAIELRDPAAELRDLDGLVLTGGVDISPGHFGEELHPKVTRTDPERDAFELRLLSEALSHDLPVLAICRGHQLLNVAFGGRLLQHIESGAHRAHYSVEGYPSRWHAVTIERDSKLFVLLGAEELVVNSRHHQAVTPDRLVPALRPVAHSYDGIVEGVESREHSWVIGVQWHPERPEPAHTGFAPISARLFEGLVAASANVKAST